MDKFLKLRQNSPQTSAIMPIPSPYNMLLWGHVLNTTNHHSTHIEPSDPMPPFNPNQAKFSNFNQNDYQIPLLGSPWFDLGRRVIESSHPLRFKSEKEL